MPRRKLYQALLTLPYIALLGCAGLAYLLGFFDRWLSQDPLTNILGSILVFFLGSALIWGPLYTWMVVVMLLWGRGRSLAEVRRLYLLSPLLLAGSMGYPALLVDPWEALRLVVGGLLQMNNLTYVTVRLFDEFDPLNFLQVGLAWAVMAVVCTLVGYAFVGIGLGIERGLERRGQLRDEPERPGAAAAHLLNESVVR